MTSGAAASRYARALFDVVLREGGDVGRVEADLQQFVALFAAHPALTGILSNPAIPAAKKKGVVQALLDRAPGISPVLAKLILMMADRDRVALLPEVARQYRDRVLTHQHVIRGEVTTAVALPPEKLKALEQQLQQATGWTVTLEPKIDPSIIGGIVTRVGGTVYDGSVTSQLQKMKQNLIDAGQ